MEAFDCTLVAGVVEWSRHVADLVPVITHCHVEKERSKVISGLCNRQTDMTRTIFNGKWLLQYSSFTLLQADYKTMEKCDYTSQR